ncbi:MAG TPA: agmatine deiminase family protein, partial [Candidatus Sulfotelmatobacter sp.]|nr:agmatine deiminase family protein [Candidatus Sulfotelmatobacter sp.]
EPHAATWLAWPHNHSDWPGKFEAIPWVFADIIRHLSRVEDVNLIVASVREKRTAQEVLRRSHIDARRVKFHLWPTNRIWTRDSGPIFIKDQIKDEDSVALTNWRFNAWAKYPDWKHDNRLPELIAKKLKLRQFTPLIAGKGKPHHVVLEGGSIDVNGQGLMLSTEECHLSKVQQRNPSLTRAQLEQVFADYLGVEKVIWLGCGIKGDDTHGHVDDISRFVAPDTVLTAVEPSRADANYEPLQENLRRLRAATDLNGRKLQIIELPLPRPVIFRGQRLPASYANFYIANNLVLVPTFNDPNDRVALNLLADVFPTREIAGIHCGDFIWGLGAIHCMTQQQPA